MTPASLLRSLIRDGLDWSGHSPRSRYVVVTVMTWPLQGLFAASRLPGDLLVAQFDGATSSPGYQRNPHGLLRQGLGLGRVFLAQTLRAASVSLVTETGSNRSVSCSLSVSTLSALRRFAGLGWRPLIVGESEKPLCSLAGLSVQLGIAVKQILHSAIRVF